MFQENVVERQIQAFQVGSANNQVQESQFGGDALTLAAASNFAEVSVRSLRRFIPEGLILPRRGSKKKILLDRQKFFQFLRAARAEAKIQEKLPKKVGRPRKFILGGFRGGK